MFEGRDHVKFFHVMQGVVFHHPIRVHGYFENVPLEFPNKVKHASFIIIMLFYGGFEYMTSENGSVPAGSFTLTNKIFGYFSKGFFKLLNKVKKGVS